MGNIVEPLEVLEPPEVLSGRQLVEACKALASTLQLNAADLAVVVGVSEPVARGVLARGRAPKARRSKALFSSFIARAALAARREDLHLPALGRP